MRLILIPRQEPTLDPNEALPPGMIHRADTPCPFAKGDTHKDPGRTCCSIDATEATRVFYALGDELVVRLMRDCLDEKHIDRLTPSMRVTLSEATATYRAHQAEATQPSESTTESTDGSFLAWSLEEFESAVASAQRVIVWYERLASLGFGAHAWY